MSFFFCTFFKLEEGGNVSHRIPLATRVEPLCLFMRIRTPKHLTLAQLRGLSKQRSKNLKRDRFTKEVRDDDLKKCPRRDSNSHPSYPCSPCEGFEVRKPIRETFGQMPCSVWRPARSEYQKYARRDTVPLMGIRTPNDLRLAP
jgi:hypothetical protein